MANSAVLELILKANSFVAAAKQAEGALTGVAATADKTQTQINRSVTIGQGHHLRAIRTQQVAVAQYEDWRVNAARQAADLREFIARREAATIAAANKSVVASTATVAATTEAVAKKSVLAGAGLGQLRESLGSLAAQALGVNPIFGRLTNVLGSLAIGSVFTIAVMAGIAAIGAAYTKMAGEAKKAREEAKKFIDELDKARKEAAYGATGKQQETMTRATAAVTVLERNLAYTRALIRAAEDRGRGGEYLLEMQARETAQENALTEARKRAAFATAEYARASQENFRNTVSIIEDAIPKLDAATKKTLAWAEALARVGAAPALPAAGVVGSSIPTMQSVGITPIAGFGNPAYQALLRQAVKDNDAAAKESADMWEQSFEAAIEGIQQTFARGFEDILTDGLSGFDDFADSLVDLFRGVAAQIAAALTSKALGLDRALADLRKPGGGGLAAAAQGGAYAVSAAAVLNLVSAIIEVGKAAKEAARQMRELERSVSKDIDDMLLSLQPDSLEKRMATALAPLRDMWDAVNKAANKHDPEWMVREIARLDELGRLIVQKVIDEWNAELEQAATTAADAAEAEAELVAEQNALAQAARDAAQALVEENRIRSEDLQVRLLVARGMDEEAAAFRRYLERERELAAARNDEERAILLQIYAAEDATAARDREREAIRSQVEALNDAEQASRSLAEQMASLTDSFAQSGQNLYADFLESEGMDREAYRARQAAWAAEMKDKYMGWYEQGLISWDQLMNNYFPMIDKIFENRMNQWDQQHATTGTAIEGGAAEGAVAAAKAREDEARNEVIRSVAGISETTAVRMADLTMTSNIWLAEIALNTRGLRRGTDGASLPMVGGQARGPNVLVNVANYAPINAGTPASIGADIGKSISRYLANDQNATARAGGDATV